MRNIPPRIPPHDERYAASKSARRGRLDAALTESQSAARPILRHLGGNPAVVSRFWEKVAIAGPDDCWDWTASKSGKGYGNFKIASFEPRQAHRVAWVIANQRDTDGLLVRHTCDRPSCCNPAHLLLGTAKDNSDDKFSRGRARNSRQDGENNGHAILTTEQVGQIVKALQAGEGNGQIAARFPVSDSLVSRIRTGRSWIKEAAAFGWTPRRLVAPPPRHPIAHLNTIAQGGVA